MFKEEKKIEILLDVVIESTQQYLIIIKKFKKKKHVIGLNDKRLQYHPTTSTAMELNFVTLKFWWKKIPGYYECMRAREIFRNVINKCLFIRKNYKYRGS